MDRKETKQLYRSRTASVYNTFISRISSIHQGLYKVAEVIGTMIQNRKYISIYINTQPGDGADAGLFGSSCREPGRQGGVGSGKEFFTLVLNDMSEGGQKWGNRACGHRCAPHTHTTQTDTGESQTVQQCLENKLGTSLRNRSLLGRARCGK